MTERNCAKWRRESVPAGLRDLTFYPYLPAATVGTTDPRACSPLRLHVVALGHGASVPPSRKPRCPRKADGGRGRMIDAHNCPKLGTSAGRRFASIIFAWLGSAKALVIELAA